MLTQLDALMKDETPHVEEDDDSIHTLFYLRQIGKTCGYNRYAMTVVLAAIDDMISRRKRTQSIPCIPLGPIRAYLDHLSTETAGIEQDKRAEKVLRLTLGLYQVDLAGPDGAPLKLWPFEPQVMKASRFGPLRPRSASSSQVVGGAATKPRKQSARRYPKLHRSTSANRPLRSGVKAARKQKLKSKMIVVQSLGGASRSCATVPKRPREVLPSRLSGGVPTRKAIRLNARARPPANGRALRTRNPTFWRPVRWPELEEVSSRSLYDLQRKIITMLALVGQPIDATVLTGNSEIAEALERVAEECHAFVQKSRTKASADKDWKIVWEARGAGTAKDNNVDWIEPFQPDLADPIKSKKHLPMYHRQQLLMRVLDLMVHRCLIFRIAPKDLNTRFPEDGTGAHAKPGSFKPFTGAFHRFATHKTMRRFIFEEFKVPQVDYADVDQLTVSQYITQPSDLPRPTPIAHRDIRKMLDQLCTFERYAGDPPHRTLDPFQTNGMDPHWRKRIERGRLRAGYGVLRSIYSLGVLSRFDSLASDDEHVELPTGGYFESHRKRVRWVLRRAQELDTPYERGASKRQNSELRALHAEEIVWLFNEAGVLSLTEGRISDAAVLLLQAKKTTKDLLEERVDGPLTRRIQLNKVMVDIEHGDLRDAQRTLAKLAKVKGETEIFYFFVLGYRGVLNMMRGNIETGLDRLTQAVKNLRRMKRYRAAAIFLTHKANAISARGEPHLAEALSHIEDAVKLAALGRHEDTRQIALLFMIRFKIERDYSNPQKLPDFELIKQLEPIEVYARKMGMHGLQARIALVRSRYGFLIKDFDAAARHAQEALKLATMHEMVVVKIEALLALGRSMKGTKAGEAKTLLARAAEIASKSDYQLRSPDIAQALVEE